MPAMEVVEGPAQPDVLTDSVMGKYSLAAQFTNAALAKVLEACRPGANTAALCLLGDALMQEGTSRVFKRDKQLEKGSAEPTTVNVNNCLGGYAPMEEEGAYILQAGDLVKVSLGVHIDGYTAKACHTMLVTQGQQSEAIQGPVADVTVATCAATEAVTRLLAQAQPPSALEDTQSVTLAQLRSLVEACAAAFDVRVCEGSKVRRLRRFLVGQATVEEEALDENDRPKQITWVYRPVTAPAQTSADRLQAEEEETTQVSPGEVWLLDLAFSTGKGAVRPHGVLRPTLYARDYGVTYQPKLKASQETLREVTATKSVFPFHLRTLSNQKVARMGVSECERKGLLVAYPVLCEHPKEFVSRQASTLALLGKEVVKLTGTTGDVPWVKSAHSVEDGSDLAKCLALPLKVRKASAVVESSAMEL
ncbi:peptidase M24, structural domain-containing protein [Protomyces lactucae-debilis]|uniref:Probable metalloprotease ARX1 n=1 Tax=Protomyces lactucae-debilis TaxID=2754530 RepID=A0A1Y2EW44_PROLT|nr:peptidase M24, structural domain-containing protein [Protomyces lactucae-debilis]ORY75809.1 peptidase M24, structural domain-containing protein [Protomyces lactucae-debilis]